MTRGDSVQGPLTSGPGGDRLADQLLSWFRPKLLGHVSTREANGFGVEKVGGG
jgi:hypothetical protein